LARPYSALREGIRTSAGLRRAVEEKLPTVPAVPAFLASQVLQLDMKLHELQGMEGLCRGAQARGVIEEMEALIGSEEAPKAPPTGSKRLQGRMKTISKGILSDSGRTGSAFTKPAQAAYQPCRDIFEAQAAASRKMWRSRRLVLERPSSLRK